MFSPEQIPTYLDCKQSLFLFRFSEGTEYTHAWASSDEAASREKRVAICARNA